MITTPTTRHLAAWTSLLLACAALLAPAASRAAAEPTAVRQLMQASGFDDALDTIVTSAADGIVASLPQDNPNITPDVREAVRAATRAAFEPARIRPLAQARLAQARLAEGLEAADLPPLQQWYDSPEGRAMVAVELAATRQQADPAAAMALGAQRLAEADAPRRAVYEAIVRDTLAADAMTAIATGIAMAVQRGAASQASRGPAPSTRELRQQLEQQRPQMLKVFEAVALSTSALTYAEVPMARLEPYVAFLQTAAARRYYLVGYDAIRIALEDAYEEFGRRLPGTREESRT